MADDKKEVKPNSNESEDNSGAAEKTQEVKPKEQKNDTNNPEEKVGTPAKASKKTKEKADVQIPAKFKSLVEEVEKMSVIELSELVKILEERFGVSSAVPMAAAAAPAGGGDANEAAAEEGKSEFTIILKEAGEKKIDVIKAVREISGLGLAESKAVVDGAPKTVKDNAPKDEAETAKKKLEDAGAKVELQ